MKKTLMQEKENNGDESEKQVVHLQHHGKGVNSTILPSKEKTVRWWCFAMGGFLSFLVGYGWPRSRSWDNGRDDQQNKIEKEESHLNHAAPAPDLSTFRLRALLRMPFAPVTI